ncbi:MAG: type I secretion C-terminal target domain-containing protein [Alphaproteobacteria bacterium]|nr:type I secretion C-terminal target domain-containing protein [Alphaproteobacteria bacterium]
MATFDIFRDYPTVGGGNVVSVDRFALDVANLLRLGTYAAGDGQGFAVTYSGTIGYRLEVGGENIVYQNGLPTGGTITSFRLFGADGLELLRIGGLSLDLPEALTRANPTGDFFGLLYAGDDLIRLGPGLSADIAMFGAGAGADTVDATANDSLIGSSSADTLDGGSGADRMIGGNGDDLYIVDNARDRIQESAGPVEGRDTVRVVGDLATWRLGANLENLEYAGTGDFRGTGNGLRNLIRGGAGADSLSGGGGNDTLEGGAGADLLTGGTGADLFRLAADAVDTITDFSSRQGDGLGIGNLLADGTPRNLAALVEGGYLRFEQAGRDLNLFLDADGAAGAGAEVQLAILRNVAALTEADFQLA